MRSRIRFELSDRGAIPPHVTRKITQNTRLSFSHMQEGLGTRLVVMCVFPQSHSQIQQEYQTFYHKSFRVSDYMARADAKLRDLLEACEGIKVGTDLHPDLV